MLLWEQSDFPGDSVAENLPAMQEMQVWSLGREDPLEEEMGTHSSILAWRIPWSEEPAGLQSMGLQRIRHDWETEYAGMGTGNSQYFWLLLIPLTL